MTAIIYEDLRLTIPAREALERAGNTCTPSRTAWPGGPQLYDVTLRTAPDGGLVLCLIGSGDRGMRLAAEPEYPGEEAAEVMRGHRGTEL